MVLKFCGGLWDAGRTDDDLDAAASRQRRLQERLREGSSNRQQAKFQKEVRVVFDSKRPHGIQFVRDDTPGITLGYACLVASINAVLRGQAAEYNARCKANGDYAHVIVEGMRVRSVDTVDMKDTAFDVVLERIAKGCAGSAGCAVTFADVSSELIAGRSTPKLRTVGKLVLAAQRAQLKSPTSPQKVALTSSPASSPASPRTVFNANASPKVSKWSSVLTTVRESNKYKTNQSDVLASDLAHKNAHLEAQLLILKGKLTTLEHEKARLESGRSESTQDSTERLDTLQADCRALQIELQKAQDESVRASQRHRSAADENESLKSEITTLQSVMSHLQHQYDGVLLQMQELQIEHRDIQHDAEELHNRLVAAQLAKSELNDQITTIKREQSKELATCAAIQADLAGANEPSTSGGTASPSQRRRSSTVAAASDSQAIALLKQTIQSRDALQSQNDELHIELSCHETTIQHQQDQLIELEDKLTAITQISDSLRDQVRALIAAKAATLPPQEQQETVRVPRTNTNAGNEAEIRELQRQLSAERSANARIQSALQTLQDRARAKLEQHEKEQLFLMQFKEQLVKGITVTKFGTRGSPHVRVLFSDAQCHWLSWRTPSDGATSPRADAKVETMDLVEVLLGATTETFAPHKPEIPARCLSLVFCHPCRTLDLEVETRDRALFVRRGFRLLLEHAAEKRRRHEDENAAAVSK